MTYGQSHFHNKGNRVTIQPSAVSGQRSAVSGQRSAFPNSDKKMLTCFIQKLMTDS
ncbi:MULTISPECIES: hypothetical protein [Moorena]|uniref:Uncharacterized protein n=1 Tax=Moorena producens (strain JHB) TaxID=1454205 RepID=A0A9Q9SU55_MOOP1|nr:MULTISPECIES: hypothetical protein [Moorena]NEQ16636.1 hypothetical protein [Moorena sp. SIO3E2]NEP69256.1 hypothetical protein [Moorena sp. SIO3A5]NEQ08095.1 hypothetical protein [Moorena sp. SIO4E2]NER89661.1 hypothetical protein [Moorena sp. SIO3A2]NES46100.1 hypothetical protein [Moorena sp. SIO2C4]